METHLKELQAPPAEQDAAMEAEHQQQQQLQQPTPQQQQQPHMSTSPAVSCDGYGLTGNTDVLASQADWLFHLGQYADAYQLTSNILSADPYATRALTTHLAAALQLGHKNELFLRWEALYTTKDTVVVRYQQVCSLLYMLADFEAVLCCTDP